MSTSVWKFPVRVTDEAVIEIPEGAHILSVGVQGDQLCVWAHVDPDARLVRRSILMAGTGHRREDLVWSDFVGTVQMLDGQFVFHVFDGGELSE